MPKNGRGSSRSTASREASDERAERELNTEITAAVAATEREIVDDVLSDDPLDLDGDVSLEEMGEGLEGDDLIDDGDDEDEDKPVAAKGKQPAGKRQARGEESDDEDEDEGVDDLEAVDEDGDEDGDGDDADGDDDGDDADDRQRDSRTGRFVPASRVKEEADKRRARERELDDRDLELAALRATVEELRTQRPAPAAPKVEKPAPPPKPDMFAEPEAYEAWMEAKMEREIEERVSRAVSTVTTRSTMQRADESFAEAANGERRFEFHAAYQALTSLPKTPENGRLATKILHAPDPAEALWDWWEENGGPEYRDEVAQALGFRLERQERGRPSNGSRRQPQDEPRREFRGAQRLPRSLNGSIGGGRHQVDPRTLDDSDQAVADYIFAR